MRLVQQSQSTHSPVYIQPPDSQFYNQSSTQPVHEQPCLHASQSAHTSTQASPYTALTTHSPDQPESSSNTQRSRQTQPSLYTVLPSHTLEYTYPQKLSCTQYLYTTLNVHSIVCTDPSRYTSLSVHKFV